MAPLALAGFVVGLLLAAQVGPVTLLIVRSVLRGGRAVLVGLAMALAVATVDVLYGTVGLLGAGRLAEGSALALGLGVTSAAILVVLGVRTMWLGLRARLGLESAADVVHVRSAFVTALAATALNPLTIALWTVSFPAAAPGSASVSVANAAALVAGAAVGTLTWHSGFATGIALARHRVGHRVLGAVDLCTGAVLVAFGGLLGYRAVADR